MNIRKMNRSDENTKKISDKNIDENKNICRPTLVSYVIHYSILISYLLYFNII